MEFLNLLSAWGLEDYSNLFVDEGISDESFCLIDNETINKIFVKMGPRLIFKKKFNEYINVSQVNSSNSSDKLVDNHGLDSSVDVIHELTRSTSSHSSSCSFYTYEPDDELIAILEKENTSINEHLSPKKLKQSSVFCLGLENVLNKSPDGRIILLNKHKLNHDLRQKLSKIIINELLKNHDSEIKREDFIKATEEIINFFPGEQKETYYVPYTSAKTGLRLPARGKLWSRYVNVKAALRLANNSLLKNYQSTSTPQPSSDHISIEIENDLCFLKSGTEPYIRVLEAWETTYKRRYELYYKSTSKSENMYATFPCLRCAFGIDLLESDFNKLYPDKIDTVYTEWPIIYEAILKEAKERKIQLPLNTTDKSTEALLVLPYLFTPVTLRRSSTKNKNRNWRPTRTEIQSSFFFHVKTSEELEVILLRRKAALDEFNLPLQPCGVIIGDNFEEYLVVCCGYRYKCSTSIRCLELLFKAIHALNLEYPPESKHVWHFIQDMVFKIPVHSKSTSTASVIADITFHLVNR